MGPWFQNQEAFIRMINEGEAGEEGDLGGLGSGEGTGDLDQPGVIQVSPQDKEAIERVRKFTYHFLNIYFYLFCFFS